MKKLLVIPAVFISLSLLLPVQETAAYDEYTTHPALTQEITRFYNLSFPNDKLSDEEMEWVIQGSSEEDTPPRWINHFYDPIRKIGWTGDKTGSIPQSVVALLSKIGLSTESPHSAVDWANNYTAQDRFDSYGGNHTWTKGLEEYANGDKKAAYLTLGHVLHLLEDMTVPDHTRDDTHAHDMSALTGDEGSPYEDYSTKWRRETIESLDIPGKLAREGIQPTNLSTVEDYLVSTAEYSNKYFFSKDTINDPKYEFPKVIREDQVFAYGTDDSGKEFYLAKVDFHKDQNNQLLKNYSIKNVTEHYLILDAYFDHLSRKAVTNGAGLLHLFKQKGEDALVNKDFPVHLVTIDRSKLKYFDIPSFSLIGELGKAKSMFANAATATGNAILAIRNTIWGWFKPDSNPLTQNTNEVQLIEPFVPQVLGTEISPTPKTSPNPLIVLAPPAPVIPAPIVISLPSNFAPPSAGTVSPSPAPLPFYGGGGAGPQSTPSVAPAVNTPPPSPQPPALVPLPESSNATSTSDAATTTVAATATSTSTSTEPEESSSTVVVSATPANHIVISEILFDAEGSDEGKEYIELYNPLTTSADLAGWSLKYLKGNSTSTTSLALLRANDRSPDNGIIPAQGFYLLGLNNYSPANYEGKEADAKRSAALPNGSERITVKLFDAFGHEIDALAYDKDVIPSAGNSLERMTIAYGACISAREIGEFTGNLCDTDGFAEEASARAAPTPQNSDSLPEPRDKLAIHSFTLSFVSSTLQIASSWDVGPDVTGATSTNIYTFDGTPAPTTSFTKNIGEVGRDYIFELAASDRDGLTTRASSTVSVPSLLDAVYFYKNPALGSTDYLIDLRYAHAPFIPDIFGRHAWQAVVVYVNRTPNGANSTLTTAGNWQAGDREGVLTSAVFGLTPDRSTGVGGGLNNSSFLIPTEDNLMILSGSAGPRAFTPDDYVTIAYYDFSNSGGGTQDLSLVASDMKKYFFRETSPQSSPTVPRNLEANFDSLNLKLALSWTVSTDSDSPDDAIEYQVAMSTSTSIREEDWKTQDCCGAIGRRTSAEVPVVYPHSYTIGVRAVDNFGNPSEAGVLSWNFPEGFVVLPSQLDHGASIDRAWGDRGQKVFIPEKAKVDMVALWGRKEGGTSCCATSYLEIHNDDEGRIGEMIATSSAVTIGGGTDEQENQYTFDTPVILEKDTSYWLVPVMNGGNSTLVFGNEHDAYPDGFWSKVPIHDIYFRFHVVFP